MKEKLRLLLEEKLKPFCKKENMILMVLAGILLLIISLPTGRRKNETVTEGALSLERMQAQGEGGGEKEEQRTDADMPGEEFDEEDYRLRIQKELEEMLGGIDGAGEVHVMITFRESEELVVEKDREKTQRQTSESGAMGTEKSGSESTLSENTVTGGEKAPFVTKKIYPKVEGVVVAAQGVGQGHVRADISEAVQALFGLEAHRIKVLKLGNKSSK